MEYRRMKPGEEAEICALVARVFEEFVAPDFSREGIDEFRRYARADALAARATSGHTVLVAVAEGCLAGMVEIRGTDHIAMLFVERRGRGVGKELVRRAVRLCRQQAPDTAAVRVHASRHAVPIYRRMGFEAEGGERTENGIVYLPMVLRLRAGGAR